jgi:hypothetical protein
MKTTHETTRAERLQPITDAMDIERKTKKETVTHFISMTVLYDYWYDCIFLSNHV